MKVFQVHPRYRQAGGEGTVARAEAALLRAAALGPANRIQSGDTRAWSDALASLADDNHVDRGGKLARNACDEQFTPTQALAKMERAHGRVAA